MRSSDANLRRRTVIAADGLVIGEIAALFLDSETLKVESLQIDLRKQTAEELGASHSFFRAGSIEIPVGAIAVAHGGRVSVESALDRGSTFTFMVPIGGPPPPRA